MKQLYSFSVAYIFVFTAGIFGNVAIFLTVRKSSDMRRLTTYFIINLAAADLLVLIFCLPFTLAANIYQGKKLTVRLKRTLLIKPFNQIIIFEEK